MPHRPFPPVWPALFASLLLAACTVEDPIATNHVPIPSFEEFEASVAIFPPTGAYLVEGDIQIRSRAALEAYYQRIYQNGALTVDQHGGADNLWSDTDKRQLTYCVSSSHFTASSGDYSYANVVADLAEALGDWEAVADVQFHHISSEDGNCNASNNNVMFDVRSFSEPMSNGTITVGSAFFPDEGRSDRTIWINDQANYNNLVGSFMGMLRHEVGHVLGFRHEHIRKNGCTESAAWRDVTEYNQSSVMHYVMTSCNGDGDSNNSLTTKDKDGAASLYGPAGGVLMLEGATNWGSGADANAIAFGDVDGDGRDEIGVARDHSSNARYFIYDDAYAGFAILYEGGNTWGSKAEATAIAFGDIDGDGRDEFIVGRDFDDNDRYWIHDDANANFAILKQDGDGWPSDAHVTDVAMGDVDGDGRDEIAIARYSKSTTDTAHYWILDDGNANFAVLRTGGTGWGDSNAYASAVAFGDVDNDGRDEFAVGRYASSNERFWVLEDKNSNFAVIHSGGTGWNADAYVTDLAFGNVDSDGREELGVTRYYTQNKRYYVYDDENANFNLLEGAGGSWDANAFASAIAFGDVDRDGIDEVAIGVDHGSGTRYFVLDDDNAGYTRLINGGVSWNDKVRALAFGNVDNDADAELAVAGEIGNSVRWVVANHDDICRTQAIGGSGFCTEDCPCVKYQGDCDNDLECEDGTACNYNIGADFGLDSSDDVCM